MESRQAFILMIQKHHDNARYHHQNTKPHIIFDLVWLLKTEKIGEPCSFCPEPHRKEDERKLDFLLPCKCTLFHSLLLAHHVSNSKFTHDGK
jgi:hypothetical protein